MPLTYESIATFTTVNNTTASQVFSSIPQTYTDLRLIVVGNFTGNNGYRVTVNGETSWVSKWVQFDAISAAPTASSSSGQNSINFHLTDSGTDPQFLWMDFFNYTQNNKQSYVYKYAMGRNSSTSVPALITGQSVNNNNASSGITTITIQGNSGQNFLQGTNFTLYALKAA